MIYIVVLGDVKCKHYLHEFSKGLYRPKYVLQFIILLSTTSHMWSKERDTFSDRQGYILCMCVELLSNIVGNIMYSLKSV